MSNILLPDGSMNPTIRTEMFRDCLDSMDDQYKPSTDRPDMVKEQGMAVRRAVIAQLRPLLTDPKLTWGGEEEWTKLYKHMLSLYGNQFSQWSHEDLMFLCTVLHTDMMMHKIREQVQ